MRYGGIIELVFNSESKFTGPNKNFLVYDSITDTSRYKLAVYLKPYTDFLFDLAGDLIQLDEVNFYVTTDTELRMIEVDAEDSDTYIINGTTPFNGVISHNAPCFVAGTSISLPNSGHKNVEDIKIGDFVLSYNFNTSQIEEQKVKGIGSRKVEKIVKYTFNDGTILESTLDHPIHSREKGWVSKDPKYTMDAYGLKTTEATVGLKFIKENEIEVTLTNIEVISNPTIVYNVKVVENNHNFFANNMLVHNRCFVAGTKISLPDGVYKNIEEINVGEEVLTLNESSNTIEIGIVGDLKSHLVNDLIEVIFDGDTSITTTPEHPFFVNGKGYVEAKNLSINDTCIKDDMVEIMIKEIKNHEKETVVYNLLSVTENHNFFANKILVHNK